MNDLVKDLFVNEDISKPENRINLAIFHLQMYQEFHDWILKKLKIDSNSMIYPVQNISGTRPDFVIRNRNGRKVGFIEVECGTDLEQLKRFKQIHEKEGIKVYSIFGLKDYNPDISLEEIKDFISINYPKINNQQIKLSAQYLIELINNTIYTVSDTKRRPVNEDFVNSNPFLKELLNRINLAKIDKLDEFNKPIAGHVYYDTNKEKGFSLKVYSEKGNGKRISLLNISGGRPYVAFQSEAKYRDYLKHKSILIIDEWIYFINEVLKYPNKNIKYKGEVNVPVNVVFKEIDELMENIKRLV